MKPIRVSISASIVALLLGVVFFVPVPVTRIRQAGFVEVQPSERANVSIEVPAILKAVHVKEGQSVKKGKVLAEFVSLELENQRDKAIADMDIKANLVKYCDAEISKENDPEKKARLHEQRVKAESDRRSAKDAYEHVMAQIQKLTLRAPRDGVVIGLPQIDEVGKRWDREQQNTVFCAIGDKSKLRVLVPITPADYDLLLENHKKAMRQHKPLLATIRVQGHDYDTYAGRISELPKQDAKEIPIQLSTKAGGPLAVKPTGEKQLVPQSQVYLVGIDFEQADDSIAINSGAQVKIHNEYRSCAWWIYRTVATTFDAPLMFRW
jgi:putative peptide zinc metalloprotease protein